jgi:D-sedoheptulose 7-phosphate isomerase
MTNPEIVKALKKQIRNSLLESVALKERVAKELDEEIAMAALEIERAIRKHKKIILFGNGGSASDAEHIAAEFVGRFERDRRALPALTLVSNPANLTALGNDYGFDRIFSKQVEALAESGDVLIGISTSGNSPNVINGLKAGAELGCFRIGLTGRDGGGMNQEVDLSIIVPSERTCRIQEAHITIGHIISEIVEERLFQEGNEDSHG